LANIAAPQATSSLFQENPHPGRVAQAELERRYRRLVELYPRPLVTCLWYMPDLFPLKPAVWHKTTIEAYMTGLNCAIAAWRGGAKSTIAQGYQLDKMLHYEWRASAHICRSPDLVKAHAANLIHQLETNVRLQRRFHITPGTRQEQDWFQIKIGTSHKSQITFVWMTRDGSSRGLRLNAALVDDIDDRNDSAYMREQYFQNVNTTVAGALEPFEGIPEQIIAAGNLTGENSAMLQFKRVAEEAPERWIVRFIPAIEEGDTVQWTGTQPGQSTWPERRTTEWLLAKRAEMNAACAFAFEMEFQNRLVSMQDRIWSEEMFAPTYEILPARHQLVTRVYIDSAQKVTESGDETAIVTISKCVSGPEVGRYYLRDARIGRLAPDDIAGEAIRQYIGNGSRITPECDALGLETKTSKGEDPLAALIRLKGRQDNLNINVHALVPAEHGDKRQRSLKAVPIGRAGALYSPVNPTPDMKRCQNQMVMFSGKHDRNMPAVDDGHDAVVWGLIDLQPVERRPETEARQIELKGRLRAVA